MKLLEHTPERALVALGDGGEKGGSNDGAFDDNMNIPKPGTLLFTFAKSEAMVQPLFSWGAWDTMIWPVSVYLGSFLEKHAAEYVLGKRIVELGAGLGVPGMSCACNGASDVVLTECGNSLAHLSDAIKENFPRQGAVTPRCRELDWADEATVGAFSSEFSAQLILCADGISTDVS